MMKGSVCQEDITILNMYVSNKRAANAIGKLHITDTYKYVKQKNQRRNRQIHQHD